MKKLVLTRPIKDGENEIKELQVKEEHEINAIDIFGISANSDGTTDLGSYVEAVANISGITTAQVGVLSPKDYMYLTGVVGKSLEA